MSPDRSQPSQSKDAPIRTLEQAGAYLDGLINRERRPDLSGPRMGLASIRRLLARVGNPERGLPVVHVAGSKGKGSTCLLAEAVLRAAGERVGTFTSPHLERWSERFRIDGVEIGGTQLASAVERLRPHVDALRAERPRSAPTFFDATTAAALLLFAEARLDRVLLEVGLGGRLDSTNAVMSAVTCITSIELEHTDKLGDTHAAIAREKAGILKPGVPSVMGRLPSEAEDVVRARARELAVPLATLGRDFDVSTVAIGTSGQELHYRESDGFEFTARLPVLGAFQADNAALAIAAIRRLGDHSDAALVAAARRGLAAVELPGRIEVLGRSPWVVVDSAHTVVSARALAKTLDSFASARTHLVLSVSADKDLAAILDALLPCANLVTLTRADPVRSLSPAEVADAVRQVRGPDLELRVVPNPHLAIRAAREALARDDLLCVAGSFYLAGLARTVLRTTGVPLVSRRSAPTPTGPATRGPSG